MGKMQLSGYKSYKPAGIKWLGEIPEHWQVKRVKDIANTTSGTTPTSNNRFYYENGEFNWIRTTDLNNGKLIETEYKVTPLAMQECRLSFLPVDSVLVAMYGGFGSIGKNAILKRASTINQSICAILPNPRKFDSVYLQYFLHYFRDAWRLFADGARKDPNINQDAVKNLFVIQPPVNEQVQIGQFLDRKTLALDKQTKLLERKISAFEALRKTLINETVCRGLDPVAPRKPSSLEGLGDIPAHWQEVRLKDVADFRFSNVDKKEKEGEAEVLLCNYVDVYKNDFIVANLPFMPSTANEADIKRFSLRKGDVLITKDSESHEDIAVPALVTADLQNVVCGYHLALIRAKSANLLPAYLYYLFKSTRFNHGFAVQAKGITRVGLSINSLSDALTLLPPAQEQIEIAAFLDQKTQKIDSIVTNLKAQIDTLKELRKTLINEVVTGKLKVTE